MIPETVTKWGDPDLIKAYEELERLSHDPNMKVIYEARLKQFTDQISVMESYYTEGIDKGIEKGKKLGLAAAVRKLLLHGEEVKAVAELLDLTETDVLLIQEQIEHSDTKKE